MRRLIGAIVVVMACATPTAAQVVLGHGQLTLDSANGGERLSTTRPCAGISLKAACANTVDVMVGGSGLNYSSSKGRTLAPCEVLDLDIDDVSRIYVDAGTTAGQIIEYDYVVGP